jgi:hypothetical protein
LFIDARKGELADVTRPLAAVYEEGYAGAEVYLLAADAHFVYPGMKARVVIAGREKDYRPAVVTSVSAYAGERISELGLSESRVQVLLDLDDGSALIMGQKADVEFTLNTAEAALAVPKAAVFAYQEGFAVLTAVQGKTRLAPIEQAFATDTMVVVKSGLQAGDTVLLAPKQEGLKAGTRVAVSYQ